MSSFGRTSSPVLTMPLQSAVQAPFGRQLFTHPSSFGQSASWTQSFAQNMAQASRGRKRSRDEAAVNLDAPEKAPPPVEVPKESEDEWEYGPGMVLIKKSTGYVHDASNQTGTWLEEQKARDEARKVAEALELQQRQAMERPSLRSNKSSRLDVSTRPDSSPIRSSADNAAQSPSDSPSQPIVDDFTMHLGIGWSRISDDEHIQAAARGWARYIENHYPVSNAKIRLESRGLESYLVEANEGYFLFAENLRQGRLVSQDSQRALDNLKSSPPTFDGAETMMATSTPKPVDVDPMAHNEVAMDMN
ncbi:hypothetical protein RB595_005403 [Gaeumannomyces hyphopodioides]